MRGMLWPVNNQEFTLFKMKMTCCAPDAIPLRIRIISPEPLDPDLHPKEWVEVTGEIQFRPEPGKTDEFFTVMQLSSKDGVKKTDPTGLELYEK
jgi:uncharacterized membrane protein YcgQ (UPF0703/DUF1980 family)